MDRAQRLAVVDEAVSWLNTPYHPYARVKGAGVDCVMLPAEVYRRAGLIPHIEPPHYSVQAGLHSEEEMLERMVLDYGERVDEGQPGDLVLFRFGRSFSHAGIMITGTRFIHAMGSVGLVSYTDLTDAEVSERKRRFYTIRAHRP